jgi:hypothetical protein
MNGLQMRSRHGAIAAAALALTLAVPGGALADTTGGGPSDGAHITINPTVALTAKVGLTIKVDVTCDPLNSYDPVTGEPTTTTSGILDSLDVTIAQANGRTVTTTDAFMGYGAPVTCDGSTVNHFTVTALSTSTPFRKGTAVGSAGVTIFDPYQASADGGSSGNVVVKLVAP